LFLVSSGYLDEFLLSTPGFYLFWAGYCCLSVEVLLVFGAYYDVCFFIVYF